MKRVQKICWRGVVAETSDAWLGPQGEVFPKSEVVLEYPDGRRLEAP